MTQCQLQNKIISITGEHTFTLTTWIPSKQAFVGNNIHFETRGGCWTVTDVYMTLSKTTLRSLQRQAKELASIKD